VPSWLRPLRGRGPTIRLYYQDDDARADDVAMASLGDGRPGLAERNIVLQARRSQHDLRSQAPAQSRYMPDRFRQGIFVSSADGHQFRSTRRRCLPLAAQSALYYDDRAALRPHHRPTTASAGGATRRRVLSEVKDLTRGPSSASRPASARNRAQRGDQCEARSLVPLKRPAPPGKASKPTSSKPIRDRSGRHGHLRDRCHQVCLGARHLSRFRATRFHYQGPEPARFSANRRRAEVGRGRTPCRQPGRSRLEATRPAYVPVGGGGSTCFVVPADPARNEIWQFVAARGQRLRLPLALLPERPALRSSSGSARRIVAAQAAYAAAG
jgi:hypothetical protein